MPGERGRSELQTKAINQAVEKSYDLTKNEILKFGLYSALRKACCFVARKGSQNGQQQFWRGKAWIKKLLSFK